VTGQFPSSLLTGYGESFCPAPAALTSIAGAARRARLSAGTAMRN